MAANQAAPIANWAHCCTTPRCHFYSVPSPFDSLSTSSITTPSATAVATAAAVAMTVAAGQRLEVGDGSSLSFHCFHLVTL